MADKNNFRILIIDDNKSIHNDFIKILRTESYDKLDQLSEDLFGENPEPSVFPKFEIDVASQGQEGVLRIQEGLAKNIRYSLAFVDIRMPPGWDGIETIKHIWEIDKDIQIVICTAYSDYSWEETIAHLGKTDNLLILKKPFDSIAVRQLACALTTKWQLAEESRQYTKTLKQEVADQTVSLQKSLSLVKSTFESSSDGILVIDNEGHIIDYNQKLVALLRLPHDVIQSKELVAFVEHLNQHLENPKEFMEALKKTPAEIRVNVIKLKSGKIFECYSHPHRLNDKIIGRVLDFRDITKRASLEEKLKFQATHDPLTGLANRVKLLEEMKLAIRRSQLHSSFAIVFIDFDRFKLINDSLSHFVGDELLKLATERLKTVITQGDTLSRLGGDEFVIIFLNTEKKEYLENKLFRLVELFQTPFQLSDRQLILTISAGVSLYPKDGTTVDVLLRNADVAMYRAKSKMGNGFQFYTSEMSMRSLEELDQETELRQAIKNEEFFLVYQPQLDLNKENLIAVEALIRWSHPKKGILLPIDFIPLAEEIGLLVPIGEWALREACRQNKAWQNAGLPKIRVAVNVSQQQFKQQNIVDLIKNILKETDLEPQYLEIELTENVILSHREVIKTVSALKEIGVMIAIDDFGTGYSSLSYLHKLPLDRLKIDSSFIQHITTASDDDVIVRAVIAMAKNLNLEVLAEGVETIDQLNFLKKNECVDVQGFYFSKPLTAGELEEFIKNPHKMKSEQL